MRDGWVSTFRWLVVVVAVAIASYYIGVIHGMDVEAFNAAMVAEGEPWSQCGLVWVVAKGDTPWDIAGECYGRDRTGYWAHEIVRLNGVDAGSLRVGMVLDLPERGRR